MLIDDVHALPKSVKTRLKTKAARQQWMHLYNARYATHGHQPNAHAEAWEALRNGVGKAMTMDDFRVFLPIAKIDKDRRTVSGYASTPAKDGDGERVSLKAVKKALPDYMEYGNIREMHALKAVGVAQEANIDTKGLYLTAYIGDDAAWKKCIPTKLDDGTEVPPIYKGFSIGGRKIAKDGDEITELELTEISIVDRPSNPECRIDVAKSAKNTEAAPAHLVKVKPKASAEAKALAKMARIVEDLAKAGPPAAHDGFSLPAKSGDNSSPKDDETQNNKSASDGPKPCEKHGKVNCEDCATDKAAGAQPCEKHGAIDCDKCATEKREFDAKQRTAAASSGAAMPDGSFPIENAKDLQNAIRLAGHGKNPKAAKKHIRARAKALGLSDKLPDDWQKSKKVKKALMNAALGVQPLDFFTLRKTDAPIFAIDDPFDLRKGMNTAASLSYSFDSIRDAQRRLLMEAKREGGDMKDKVLSQKLGTIAKDLADVIGQKAIHEGSEALDLSDGDDAFIVEMFGEGYTMEKIMNAAGSGDPLTDAVAAMMKRAATPTRAMQLAKADDNVKKARKATKNAQAAIEDCAKMLKAAYIAKAAKKSEKKPSDDDDDGFDHAGAMGKLQKAYQELETAKTMNKAARAQIAKAVARSGQRGQETNDADPGFYEVPAGVTDLSPAAIAGAGPGSKTSVGQPAMYPGDGSVYPGKAAGEGNNMRKFANKDGLVPVQIAELLAKSAQNETELELLRRLPAATSGGRRPMAFDMGKAFGTGGQQDLTKALFEGVDVNAIGSGDELRHTSEVGKMIGNYIGNFGKSIMDPTFRGMAGTD